MTPIPLYCWSITHEQLFDPPSAFRLQGDAVGHPVKGDQWVRTSIVTAAVKRLSDAGYDAVTESGSVYELRPDDIDPGFVGWLVDQGLPVDLSVLLNGHAEPVDERSWASARTARRCPFRGRR